MSDQKAAARTSIWQQKLEEIWYQGGSGGFLLWPLEILYRGLAALNRYHSSQSQIDHAVPVIVVGNISVGGTGKTPLVIALVTWLQAVGYKPGIITRGYGGKAQQWPAQVKPTSNPTDYGDEPVLMAQRTGVPVVAGPDRNADIQHLQAHHDIDLVISDDGLQHYRLQRDIEIAVVDAVRGLGNRHCLPAGPLREPAARLDQCDFVIMHELLPSSTYSMQLSAKYVHQFKSMQQQPLAAWKGRNVHAVTGIGHPERFFLMLEKMGLHVTKHAFPDHHSFSMADIEFRDPLPVLMTEKDAVKCRPFASGQHWFVPVEAIVSEAFYAKIMARIKKIESEK